MAGVRYDATSVDSFELAHDDLMERQFAAIRRHRPRLFDGYAERMADCMQRGLATMDTVLSAAGVDDGDLARCREQRAQDARLDFLYGLPRSAAFGAAIGTAIDEALFGDATVDSAELTALINLFIRLLDGLVDETPDLFEPERRTFLSILEEASWAPHSDPPTIAALDRKHPVVAVTLRVMLEWLRRVKGSRIWSADPATGEQFAAVCRTALGAELATASQPSLDGDQVDIADCRRALIEKSALSVWVIALAPVCLRGWPEGVDRERYYAVARAVGYHFSWIDDICDMAADLDADRWSDVLLTLYERVQRTRAAGPFDLKDALMRAAADGEAAAELVAKGERLYCQMVDSIERLDIDPSPLLTYVADGTQSWFLAEL